MQIKIYSYNYKNYTVYNTKYKYRCKYYINLKNYLTAKLINLS